MKSSLISLEYKKGIKSTVICIDSARIDGKKWISGELMVPKQTDATFVLPGFRYWVVYLLVFFQSPSLTPLILSQNPYSREEHLNVQLTPFPIEPCI